MSKIIGVYGTLKKCKENYHLIKDEKFIRNDKVKGQLYVMKLIPLWPMLSKGNNDVEVEVYEVSDEVFESLKKMEEKHYYKTVEVMLESGKTAFMWIYENVNHLLWKPVDKY